MKTKLLLFAFLSLSSAGCFSQTEVVDVEPGPVMSPLNATHIALPSGRYSTFHSHPSGTEYIYDNMGVCIGYLSYRQRPSLDDIYTAGTHTHYVFGMGNDMVYIYTSAGVQDSITHEKFLQPKDEK